MKDYFKKLREYLEQAQRKFENIGSYWWAEENVAELKDVREILYKAAKEITFLTKEANKVDKYVKEEERKRNGN